MSTATATEGVELPAPEETTLLSKGRVGMACLILTESSFFLVFIVAYLFYIGKSLTGPYPKDVLSPPIVNTICLLSSSITITLAVRALRAGNQSAFRLWWLSTILLGVEFLVGTGLEWRGLIEDHGLTIATNLFGTTFYSLVGFHALHVTIGLALLLAVLLFALAGHVASEHAERAEVLSWYWHFVDAVWIAVFTVVYVVGR
ncbi:MAG TPA: heme-copper oxidase subunit III [Candidatus Binatia bacterium]|nr:heme-copper oxidase subunit III [Candidatus Binatia bacterium]